MDAAGVGKRAIAIGAILLIVGTPTCFFGGVAMFSSSDATLGEAAFFLGATMMAAGAVAVVIALAAFIAWLVNRP